MYVYQFSKQCFISKLKLELPLDLVKMSLASIISGFSHLSFNFACSPQVSTSTGTISKKVILSVVRPEAFILGGDEYHIDRGSQISLVCVIEKAPTPPQ